MKSNRAGFRFLFAVFPFRRWCCLAGAMLIGVCASAQNIPPVDYFVDQRDILEGSSIHVTGSNTNASFETNFEPTWAGQLGKTVWWSWKAASNGIVEIDTFGSPVDTDTMLAVFIGNRVEALSWVAWSDNTEEPLGRQSQVRFAVTQGTTYRIRVDTKQTPGEFTLNISFTTAPEIDVLALAGSASVTNDPFSSKIGLKGRHLAAIGYDGSATFEGGRIPNIGSLRTLWWEWQAESPDEVVVSTAGSNVDTVLGVFTRSDPDSDSLTRIVSNDDIEGGLTSLVRFRPQVGTYYLIQVGGKGLGARQQYPNSYAGTIILHIDQNVVIDVDERQIFFAVEIQLNTTLGAAYQLQRSRDLIQWQNEGDVFIGDGNLHHILVSTLGRPKETFRFVSP